MTTFVEEEGAEMTVEIKHLREVFDTRFSNLEAWMDHFQEYMQRLTIAVEEGAKAHTEVALLRAQSDDHKAELGKILANQERLKDEQSNMKQQIATTNVIKQAAIWLSGTIVVGLISLLVALAVG